MIVCGDTEAGTGERDRTGADTPPPGGNRAEVKEGWRGLIRVVNVTISYGE